MIKTRESQSFPSSGCSYQVIGYTGISRTLFLRFGITKTVFRLIVIGWSFAIAFAMISVSFFISLKAWRAFVALALTLTIGLNANAQDLPQVGDIQVVNGVTYQYVDSGEKNPDGSPKFVWVIIFGVCVIAGGAYAAAKIWQWGSRLRTPPVIPPVTPVTPIGTNATPRTRLSALMSSGENYSALFTERVFTEFPVGDRFSDVYWGNKLTALPYTTGVTNIVDELSAFGLTTSHSDSFSENGVPVVSGKLTKTGNLIVYHSPLGVYETNTLYMSVDLISWKPIFSFVHPKPFETEVMVENGSETVFFRLQ